VHSRRKKLARAAAGKAAVGEPAAGMPAAGKATAGKPARGGISSTPWAFRSVVELALFRVRAGERGS